MSTKKHLKFVQESMDNKPVTSLPGVGAVLGGRLAAMGFHEARDIFDQYLLLDGERYLFEEWMKEYCLATSKQSSLCFDCLTEWYENYMDGIIDS